jgi:hypothetical protein
MVGKSKALLSMSSISSIVKKVESFKKCPFPRKTTPSQGKE